jgi:hypothetical protein
MNLAALAAIDGFPACHGGAGEGAPGGRVCRPTSRGSSPRATPARMGARATTSDQRCTEAEVVVLIYAIQRFLSRYEVTAAARRGARLRALDRVARAVKQTEPLAEAAGASGGGAQSKGPTKPGQRTAASPPGGGKA